MVEEVGEVGKIDEVDKVAKVNQISENERVGKELDDARDGDDLGRQCRQECRRS